MPLTLYMHPISTVSRPVSLFDGRVVEDGTAGESLG